MRKIQGLTIVLILLIATGSAKPTDPEKNDSNDEIGKKIEEKGKTIDEISSSIEKSTDGMEGEIEKAGKGIDSPEAEKRLEIAGEGIDELSDKMDREIEEKGREIEDEAKTRESDDDNKPSTSTKSESIADKHQSLPREPSAKTFIRHAGDFDKQEALRKRMEDAVDIEGDHVEEIGNRMGNKRNLIQHTSSNIQQDKTRTRTHWSKNRKQKRQKEIGGKKHGRLIKIHKNRIKKRKLVNRNASKRRVIVPVKRKKLEKMMLYYYIVEKMKNGELPAHNLEKFFEKLDGYSESTAEPKEQPEKTAGLSGLLKMIGTNVKSESDVNSNSEVTTNLNSFIEKINKNSETDTSSGATEEKDTVDTKKPDLDSFIQLLHKKLRSDDADSVKEQEKAAPKKADLKSLVKTLMGDNGATKAKETTEDESSPIGTSNDDAEDAAKLKDMDVQKTAAQISNPSSGSELTDKQVKKMLQSISEINATLLDHGKKRKHKTWHKPKKTCTGNSCAGRDIISLLDKALHEVQKEKKTADKPKSSEAKTGKEEIKMTGEARSKSDPYAGIGFTTNQESGRNNDASEAESQSSKPVSGESRHIESHGADIGGTSQPAVQRMVHGHHDDDDDGDDEEDEEDDDYHDGDTVHGYHYPLPMHQELHHVHHHIHHREHEHEPYEHHGYHGNQLPIRASNHHEHEDFGYTPPLNVDTAPMHHYPDRHMHDHLDVDSMLRGHPYPHHQHTPEVSLEGPISLAPVYEDMHHMLNGPGIHDQTDVHYEVEMHAHPDHHEEGHHYEGHHDDYDHHDEGHHDDYHHTGYRHEVGYHHADNEDHDEDEHHDDGYHEEYHGDDDHGENGGENGDKKHFITPGNKKSDWQAKKTKHSDSKKQTLKESNKKPKRFRREEDDDDDDEQHQDQIENIPRNGYGVSRLSYLTEENGNTMEHEIGNRILDVEDVGRSIEEKVQHGVDRVTKLSNSDVEAPDYDSQGHMEHNIHREDIEEDDK